MRLEPAAEISAGPGATAVFGRVRVARDCGGVGRFLGRIKPPLRAPPRLIMKSGKAFAIVAQPVRPVPGARPGVVYCRQVVPDLERETQHILHICWKKGSHTALPEEGSSESDRPLAGMTARQSWRRPIFLHSLDQLIVFRYAMSKNTAPLRNLKK